MSDALYSKALLRLAADAHSAGRLPEPDASGTVFNPACGDKVTVDLSLKEGRIADIAHETKACVLAQASASVLGLASRGADRAGIEKLRDDLNAMLHEKSAAPAPPFDAYAAFEGAVEYTSRHRCVLLPVEAALAAFDKA
ncbi:MAG: iron-sulfur cluster assembly scaffold protein [Rhizomicrobium sp.]